MATKLSIFNGAFSELTGGRLIAEDHPSASPLNAVWETVRIDALTIETWPWVLSRYELPGVKLTGEDYEYRYPFNPQPQAITTGPLGVFDSADSREPVVEWELRAGAIYFNGQSSVWVLYQYDAPVETWPAQFAEYVRLRLCEATAFTYSGSLELRADFQRRAEEKKGEVVDSTAQATPPKRLFRRFNTTGARLGGGYPIRRTQYPADPGRP